MKDWFLWVEDMVLKAELTYTMNGGRMDPDRAEDALSRLINESERLTKNLVGNDFYGTYYPTSRHGGDWDAGRPFGVVDHYTAGTKAANTLRWFSSKPRGENVVTSSAHVVLDRNGAIIIIIDPLTTIAWHARSANPTHVGIEHVNAGLLRKDGNHFLYQNTRRYPAERIPEIQEVGSGKFWEPYQTVQIVSNVIFKRWLIEARPGMMQRKHFVDHQQIDPQRKQDCGPLWPLDGINELVFSGTAVRDMPWLEKAYLTKDDVEDFKLQVHKKFMEGLGKSPHTLRSDIPPGV
jgi:N-acetyl-anhydromuramyl-L-alanine amidase AmpD